MVTCPHCKSASFSIEGFEPTASQFRYSAVVCAGCHAPITILDFHNTGEQIKNVEKRLERIERLLEQRR